MSKKTQYTPNDLAEIQVKTPGKHAGKPAGKTGWDPGWTLVSSLCYGLASMVVGKVIDRVWERKFQGETPTGKQAAFSPKRQVILYGAITGIIYGLLERYVLRRIGRWYGGNEKDPLD